MGSNKRLVAEWQSYFFPQEDKPAVVEVLSEEDQLQRFIKFASECYIRSGTRLIPFSPLYRYQVELARIFIKYRGVVVVKDRQLGITELSTCLMLDRARSNPAYAGAVFSLTEKDAYKVSGRVKRMPSRIPNFEWEVDSLGIRKPANGGEINFRPATQNATRGLESVWDLFFDESSFLPDNLISEMYASSSPSQEMVGDYAKTAIVSTISAEGLDSWFFERFEDGLSDRYTTEELLEIAKLGGCLNLTEGAPSEPIPGFVAVPDEGGWVHVVIGHKAHPIYGADPNYVENQRSKKKLTVEQANREHNLTLPKTGGSLFNSDCIALQAKGEWEQPDPIGSYMATLDPNMGGEDDWTLLIWRIDTFPIRLVAEYHENYMLPSHCRAQSHRLMDQYNIVLLAIEKNNGGLSQAEDFATERPDLRVELVNTSGISKIINTDRLANMLTDGDFVYPPDWNGIRQMKKFSKKEREGIKEKDDAVMSAAIGFSMLELALSLIPPKIEFASTGKRVSRGIL